jgi:integrase
MFTQKIVPAESKLPKLRFRPMPAVVTDHDYAGATTLPIERFRTQKGQWVVFADGHLYARFYDTVAGKRVKVSRRIADKGTFVDSSDDCIRLRREDRKRVSCNCACCELLTAFLTRVNDQQRNAWTPQVEKVATVAEFFTNLYLPALEAGEAAWATIDTYKRIWKQYCAAHFERVRLTSFSTKDASAFLRGLARKGLNRSTINIVKACVRGAFRYAVSEEIIKKDPFEDAGIFGVKVAPREKHVAYEDTEIDAVEKALPNVRSKLLFLLCALPGLRPAEAAGLRWEDTNCPCSQCVGLRQRHPQQTFLHVRRSCPKGHEQETAKTMGSNRIIKLSSSKKLVALLERHRAKCSGKGYMFKRPSGKPINASKYCSDVIAEPAKKAIGKDRWHGLYAGRRAMVTAQVKLTGNTTTASATAGHKNKGTTDGYIELLSEDGFAGQDAVGAAYDKL